MARGAGFLARGAGFLARGAAHPALWAAVRRGAAQVGPGCRGLHRGLVALLLWLPRTLHHVLLWASGTDHAVLRSVTAKERAGQEALGAVMFGSALLAGGSSYLAFQILTGGSALASAALGLCWAAMVFTIDRFFVLSAGRSDRWWKNVLTVAPRLVIAVLIGLVVSTPLTLAVFDREIGAEMAAMHQEQKAESVQRLSTNAQFGVLPQLRDQREAQLATARTATSASAVTDDPAVRDAQARVDAAAAALAAAQQDVTCEAEGRCGSGEPGAGAAYASKVAARDTATAALAAAQGELAAVQATARDGAASSRADAASAAQRLDQQITALEQQQRDAAAVEATAIDADTGLLARLSALHRLSSDNGVLASAHWLLFAFLTALEVMPVLVKLLLSLAKPSAYEEALAARSEELRARATWVSAARERELERREGRRVLLEQAEVDGLLAIAEQKVGRQLHLAEQEAARADALVATREGLRLERERMRTLRALNLDRLAEGLPPLDLDSGSPVGAVDTPVTAGAESPASGAGRVGAHRQVGVVGPVAPAEPVTPDLRSTSLLLPHPWDPREPVAVYDLRDVLRRPPGRP